MFDIIVGRSESDKQKFGNKGTIFIGRQYVKMGQSVSLSNNVYLDVVRPHVIFICGKRGSGKSYTMGVISEGIADLPDEVRNNVAVLFLDTMGIYWTMKFPNRQDAAILNKWNLKPKGLNIKIFTPLGYYKKFKSRGIPTDEPFSIRPSELTAADWCKAFGINQGDSTGIIITKTINDLKKNKKNFSLNNIINQAKEYKNFNQQIIEGVINRFKNANNWGLFSEKGTEMKNIIAPGQVSVLDVSCYATIPGSEGIKALVVGMVSQKLFLERMVERRKEEFDDLNSSMNYFSTGKRKTIRDEPLVWIVIDEAHEFIPKEGETAASDALITILREGRQPGISLILATQQPGKIHTDVMTQSDTVISHRLTAKIDVESLGLLMQSYMRKGLDRYIDNLPRSTGSAVIFDDQNERMYEIQIRPRFTWHGGGSPTAIIESKKKFDFDF